MMSRSVLIGMASSKQALEAGAKIIGVIAQDPAP